jgi:hypothetical protein
VGKCQINEGLSEETFNKRERKKSMKNGISIGPRLAMIGFMVAACSVLNVAAQDAAKAPAAQSTQTAVATQPTPVQLSAGVSDVLKLARAKVGDDTILAFISNSRATYSMGAPQVVYLKEQGVSERVITAMLIGGGPTPVANMPTAPEQSAATYAAPAQSSTAYVAPAPVAEQASTVYVAAPASAANYYAPYYYPYPYYGYYPWVVPVAIGFGGFHGGGWHR